jgi:hypothetical protein
MGVTYSIPEECAGRSYRTRGAVAVRHFAASESVWPLQGIEIGNFLLCRAVNSSFESPTNAVEHLPVSIVDVSCRLRIIHMYMSSRAPSLPSNQTLEEHRENEIWIALALQLIARRLNINARCAYDAARLFNNNQWHLITRCSCLVHAHAQ